MRLNRPVLAGALALGLTVLTACGSASNPSGSATTAAPSPASTTATAQPAVAASAALKGVTAAGPVDFTTAPKVTFATKPVSTAAVERNVLTPGTGAAATTKDTVRIRAQIFNGTSGKMLDDGYGQGRTAEGYRLGRPDLIPGFVSGLVGVQKGSRVVFSIPPKDAFGEAGNQQLGITGKDTIVVVADIADVHTTMTQIDGTQKPVPADLPQVEFKDGPTKAPTVTVPKTAAPTETKQVTLIEGTGPTVKAGQTITAQYHGVLWKDGSLFDSSWQRGSAADFPIGVKQVIPGWDNTLVGKKVGSRVLLVIPPKDGYGAQGSPPKISGTDTLVFVVDILDAN
ncbi:FKBP-type peptidylprolyl isomerase [Intrasporangium oryzae NRRL B-24470]|uniref:peptidylprolyl isomerase n=1 Tax=Intrasporangium oryzae NRRL B-24470 TaxID=1386089 RepID=W9G7S6_9MICO|nr:FKBP-type peptidyl-prolyl cis-trans isomerase [Intrasporangium oryzae]EWT00873.1 FKBP-type peptidylprolyl isomerase [Intrasporangium oryzae NRRL B-24470]